ncbi:hypothetical protein ACFX2I_004466 [Malus domestica]
MGYCYGCSVSFIRCRKIHQRNNIGCRRGRVADQTRIVRKLAVKQASRAVERRSRDKPVGIAKSKL